MNFIYAQKDMQKAYFGGGPAVFISGLVWIFSGILSESVSSLAGMLTLFFGAGMIFPLSMVLSKTFKRSGTHSRENPLGKLSIETTIMLFAGMFIAFAVSTIKAEWFFPIMLLMIGSRYMMFNTIYANSLYCFLGGVLIIAGVIFMVTNSPGYLSAILGGGLEIVFSMIISLNEKKASEQSQ